MNKRQSQPLGFGHPTHTRIRPTFYVETVYADGTIATEAFYCRLRKARDKCHAIVRFTQPPVDCVLLMESDADRTVIGEFQPRPFVALGEAARLAVS